MQSWARSLVEFWAGRPGWATRPPLPLSQLALNIAVLALLRAFIEGFVYFNFYSLLFLLLSTLTWVVYLQVLVLFFPTVVRAFARLLFGLRVKDDRHLYDFTAYLFWLVAVVPLFSLLPWERTLGLGVFATLPAFAYIPTFTVERNYLPLGMLAVIPILLVRTALFVRSYFRTSFYRSWVISCASFFILYLLFYQWIWAAATASMRRVPQHLQYAVLGPINCLGFEFISLFCVRAAWRRYRTLPQWAYWAIVILPLIGFIVCPQIGLYDVWLRAKR